jgi:hypothetical protein
MTVDPPDDLPPVYPGPNQQGVSVSVGDVFAMTSVLLTAVVQHGVAIEALARDLSTEAIEANRKAAAQIDQIVKMLHKLLERQPVDG